MQQTDKTKATSFTFFPIILPIEIPEYNDGHAQRTNVLGSLIMNRAFGKFLMSVSSVLPYIECPPMYLVSTHVYS